MPKPEVGHQNYTGSKEKGWAERGHIQLPEWSDGLEGAVREKTKNTVRYQTDGQARSPWALRDHGGELPSEGALGE